MQKDYNGYSYDTFYAKIYFSLIRALLHETQSELKPVWDFISG